MTKYIITILLFIGCSEKKEKAAPKCEHKSIPANGKIYIEHVGKMDIIGKGIQITGAKVGLYLMENNPHFTEYMFSRQMDSGFVYSTDSGTKVVFTYSDTIDIPYRP